MQKYGDDWKRIREAVPGRTYVQVKNHWLRFMQKMRNHVKNPKKILDAIKAHPASDFIEPNFSEKFPLLTSDPKNADSSSPSDSSHSDSGDKSSGSHKKSSDSGDSANKPEDDKEDSSSDQPEKDEEDSDSDSSPESEEVEEKKRGRHRRKQPSRRILPEVNPSGMLDFISCTNNCKRKKLDEAISAPQQEHGQNGNTENANEKAEINMNEEVERIVRGESVAAGSDKDGKKNEPAAAASRPQEPAEILNSLSGKLNELMMFSGRLETNYLTHCSDILPDCVLAMYWSALYGCSISLQHVLNDILLMNGNSVASVSSSPPPPPTS